MLKAHKYETNETERGREKKGSTYENLWKTRRRVK